MSSSRFYLSADQHYSIVDSLHDSVRFARHCLTPYRNSLRGRAEERSHLTQVATFVDPDGTPMLWHDFGILEGPGWASNAIGGATNLYQYGRFMGHPEVQRDAIAVLDHVLDDGFIDWETGFITGYRHILEDRLCLNYKGRNDWFCVGSMARMAHQLLRLSTILSHEQAATVSGLEERSKRMRQAALACARWIDLNVKLAPNGWVPRRNTLDGVAYSLNPEGDADILFDRSADGLFLLDLWSEITIAGLADYTSQMRELAQIFINAGGIFGSINHDTYDEHECVAYAVTFRTFKTLSTVLNDDHWRQFAYDVALRGLQQFEMKQDRHGVETQGLLFMERSWDTAYLWENAEAAMAYLEAYVDTGAKRYLNKALTILRAIAKHHHGSHGFLTEGVDWNNHVSAQHHFDQVEYGDIRYTEPLLNNLHHAEPTLFYLTQCIGR